jgi:hypothetical protein
MRKSVLIIASIFSVALLAAGLYGFVDNQLKEAGSFPANTTINQVDCSGLTVEDAALALASDRNNHNFILKKDGELAGRLTEIEFEYQIAATISEAMVHSGMSPLLTWIVKEVNPYQTNMTISKVNPSFSRQFSRLELVNDGNNKKTKNAYIDMTDADLPIVPEVYGSNIDKDRLLKDILASIETGSFELDINPSDYYVTPTVFADDPDLLAKQELYRKYLGFTITFDFGYYHEVMTPKVLSKILSYENGQAVVHEDKARQFVAKMADEYDDAGFSRYFYNDLGVRVTVYGGHSGYLLDQDSEVEWLLSALKNGKTALRSPKYIRTEQSYSKSQYGSSYVEIDLTKQHLWMYKNGSLVLSTPVVTGNVAKGTATPPGSFKVFYMQRDRILRGEDWDGSLYETPVAYWMAFNGGIGLHDAPWRYSFGGNIYKSNGSHGCINMPPRLAAAAYPMISIGFPVYVHY